MIRGELMDSALNAINQALEELSGYGFHAMRGMQDDFCLPGVGYCCISLRYDGALRTLFCQSDTGLRADDDDDVIVALEINRGSVLSSGNRLLISSPEDKTVRIGRSIVVADLQVFQIRQLLLDFVDSAVSDCRRIDDYLADAPEGGGLPAEFGRAEPESMILLSV